MQSPGTRPGSSGTPTTGTAGPSADRFAARLLEATGVLLLPSSTFGFGDSHVRIGLGRADLPPAVEALIPATRCPPSPDSLAYGPDPNPPILARSASPNVSQ
jgi:hypothetical protein